MGSTLLLCLVLLPLLAFAGLVALITFSVFHYLRKFREAVLHPMTADDHGKIYLEEQLRAEICAVVALVETDAFWEPLEQAPGFLDELKNIGLPDQVGSFDDLVAWVRAQAAKLSNASDAAKGDLQIDLDYAIPATVLLIAGIRNGVAVYKGQKNIKTALQHVIADTASLSAMSYVGKYIVNLVEPALLALVVAHIPAAAPFAPFLVRGVVSYAALRLGTQLASYLKSGSLNSAQKAYYDSLASLNSAIRKNIAKLKENAQAHYRNQAVLADMEYKRDGWFQRTFFPSVANLWTKVARVGFMDESAIVKDRLDRMMEAIADMDAIKTWDYLLEHGCLDLLVHHDDVAAKLRAVEEMIAAVEEQREKQAA